MGNFLLIFFRNLRLVVCTKDVYVTLEISSPTRISSREISVPCMVIGCPNIVRLDRQARGQGGQGRVTRTGGSMKKKKAKTGPGVQRKSNKMVHSTSHLRISHRK